jgi:hypothetical protein
MNSKIETTIIILLEETINSLEEDLSKEAGS